MSCECSLHPPRKSRVIPVVDARAATRPALDVPGRSILPKRTTRRQRAAEADAQRAGVLPEPDLFNILILNYTMKCPLACDYCCYACSPRREETMDMKLAIDLVDQAAELGVFDQCGFTGGEPLIFYDEILRITRHMHRRGLPFSMISSCYWASSPAEADRVIGDLARHGMVVFSASHDPSHENWVPVSYVRNAIDAALAKGVHVCLCSSFYDDTMRLQNIFPDYVNNPEIDFVNRIVLPDVGRTSRRSITPSSYPNVEVDPNIGGCYKRIYHDVTVFWDGNVYPCCSVYNRSTPRLCIGNVYHDALDRIWDRLEGSLLFRTIKANGFSELYALVKASDPELARRLPDPAGAIGPCHLCHVLFSDEEIFPRVLEIVDSYERRYISDALKLIRDEKGVDVETRVIRHVMDVVGNAQAQPYPEGVSHV